MLPGFERAVRDGDAAGVTRLLDEGADVNSRDRHSQTALMLAAKFGHLDVVRVLIARGAELNRSAKYHLTALMIAVIRSHAEIVRALVEAGADQSVQGSGAPGFAGKTAQDLAVGIGNQAVIEALS